MMPNDMISVAEPARLELTDVSIGYGNRLILEDINLEIAHGAQVAVVGPNGAGKSTLFKALVGLLPLREGQILIHSQPLGHHQDCVAYIPQREEVDWHFPVTVLDVVSMGRMGKSGWFRRPGDSDRKSIRKAMVQMGIDKLAGEAIGDLSGGQQQRVFLARALAQEPHILLMDEPFTGVDSSTQEVTLQLLHDLKSLKVTVLVSTHDLNMAAQEFEQVLLLNRKIIAFGTPQEVFTPEHLRQAYGSHLLTVNSEIVVEECCPPDETGGHRHD